MDEEWNDNVYTSLSGMLQPILIVPRPWLFCVLTVGVYMGEIGESIMSQILQFRVLFCIKYVNMIIKWKKKT